MIDNIYEIATYLKFESKDDFYYLQILQRKKENPRLGSNSRVIKNYYITSVEHLLNHYNEIKTLCDVFNALRGKKTIFPFGGIKPIEEDFDEDDLTDSIVLEGMANRIFKWCTDDWYDKESGNALVGLAIPEKVKKLTDYNDR